jgi:G3E family GTPase
MSALQRFLQIVVVDALGDRLMRIKGVVPIRGDRRIFVVHGVGGDLSGSFAAEEWGDASGSGSTRIAAQRRRRVARLVVIARWNEDSEAGAIRDAFARLFAARV